MDEQQYEDWLNDMEPVCGVTWVGGGSDPSSSECEEKPGHDQGPNKTEHFGLNPLGEGYVVWEGGGMCAGDRVPAKNVRFVQGKDL